MRRVILAFAITCATLTAGIAAVNPEPPKPAIVECTEADGACLTWDDIRESEWQTGQGR